MNSERKYLKTIRFVDKLKNIANRAIKKGNYEKALAAIASCGRILNSFNQFYTDDALEEMLYKIADALKGQSCFEKKAEKNETVFFYDGFGLDLRGVALMYLNALKKNGYKIIYVTNIRAQYKQENIKRAMEDADIVWEYVDMRKSYRNWTEKLFALILQYNPKSLFLYTTPYDVSGIVAFCMFAGRGDRYLIDLTDHAFWLGKCAIDYCLGSREMSASIEHYKRGIEKDKLIKLGVNLLIEEHQNHEGLPFDVKNTRYIFSGGALYKTLGDENNTYYKIVDHILSNHADIVFLYAGSGDDSQLKKLRNKFGNRAIYIPEREDFFYLIENCVLYLNTYPMFGGMMMKYCAYAKKLPITLKHNNDSDGLLLNQKTAQIEYETMDELIADVDKLLTDAAYLRKREGLLEGTVITEERFVNNLKNTIENHKTDYNHSFLEMDTTKFQAEYLERFHLADEKRDLVLYINRSLFYHFPWMFIVALKKFAGKILKNKE